MNQCVPQGALAGEHDRMMRLDLLIAAPAFQQLAIVGAFPAAHKGEHCLCQAVLPVLLQNQYNHNKNDWFLVWFFIFIFIMKSIGVGGMGAGGG